MNKLRRLDQILASLGYGSRREVRSLIHDGVVQVQGSVCRDEGAKMLPATVTVRGKTLEAPEGLLALLHKPAGWVCTHSEGEGPTIYELLPAQWLRRNPAVTSVGRLDKETSGLLLITDRGDWLQRWTSPKAEVEKVYEVEVDRPLEAPLQETFASGSILLHGEEKPCLPAKFEMVDEIHARLTITEGRYHQVRRMFASQGWHVVRLHRSRFAQYTLEDLPEGQWRLLDGPEMGQ